MTKATDKTSSKLALSDEGRHGQKSCNENSLFREKHLFLVASSSSSPRGKLTAETLTVNTSHLGLAGRHEALVHLAILHVHFDLDIHDNNSSSLIWSLPPTSSGLQSHIGLFKQVQRLLTIVNSSSVKVADLDEDGRPRRFRGLHQCLSNST